MELGGPMRVVASRFSSVAAAHRDLPAVTFRDDREWRSWSYGELADRVEGIAYGLANRGITGPVGVIATRHPVTIAALLAILKTGGHYVPLDPIFPIPRLQQMCDDAGVTAVVSVGPAFSSFPVAVHDLGGDAFSKRESYNSLRNGSIPESPAYVMFTSGSTGEPKGVVVPHRAVVRLIDSPNFISLDSTRTVLWLAPLGFDASTFEIWAPLLNGGRCVIFPPDDPPTTERLREVIRGQRVNTLWLTASIFNAIVDHDPTCLSGVGDVLTGGEPLSVPHIRRALDALPGTTITNGYGPTENTTFTACYRIPRDFDGDTPRVPIGVPVTGTDVFVVDEQFRPVPKGVEGELIATGEGLALGYLNRPEQTRERFVELARPDGTVVRGYRTGDRVVVSESGLLDYLGRFDEQVKIDGHRIEPGEIERHLLRIYGVRDARVVARAGPVGGKRLVAYVVADERARTVNFRDVLSHSLPAFLIPHAFVFLDAIPVTAQGKLDRSALPDPFRVDATTSADGATPEWALVAEAWRSILGFSVTSSDLNFFEAGGTSMDAVRLFDHLETRTGRRLDPTFVFAYPTIRRQAEALTKMIPVGNSSPSRRTQRDSVLAHRSRGPR